MPLGLFSLPEMFGTTDRPVIIKGKGQDGTSYVVLTAQGSRITAHRSKGKVR